MSLLTKCTFSTKTSHVIYYMVVDQIFHMNMQEFQGLVGVDAIKDTMSDFIVLTLGTVFSAILDRYKR